MRPVAELDIENLVGFFEVKLRHKESGRVWAYRQTDDHALDRQGLANALAYFTIYTFNGNNYDLPILVLALHGADNATLKQAGDNIICRGLKPWDFYTQYGIRTPDYIDHIDLMEVAPGVGVGLKMYMARMHAPTIQDLPVDPNIPVPPTMFQTIGDYCDNDLVGTGMMREVCAERLKLREALSAKYRVDLRSKSDAQIAEAVIKAQLDFIPERRYIPHGYTFAYEPPAYIEYATEPMRELLETVRRSRFMVGNKEEAIILYGSAEGVRTGVQIPPELKGRDIVIGGSTYRLGIGGLHSQEESVSYYARDGWKLIDIDVKSYYPSMILNAGMVPEQLGPAFLTIYRSIYDKRLADKAEAQRLGNLLPYLSHEAEAEAKALHAETKTSEGGLKIVLNGTFGKLFSKYSIFYAPELGIRVTLTGQLSLLMLIEMMELSGIRVVSANTDGIVLLVPPGMEPIARSNVAWWERRTGLEMEDSHYSSIHFRDVNNYVAITTSGKAKRKGIFAKPGLLENKHPDKAICAEAAVQYLLNGVPVEVTVRGCTDIREFVVVRGVKGGGEWVRPDMPSEYLGKAVRWYYGTQQGYIAYCSNGNKVAGSDGATPIMRLPDALPLDVKYGHYVAVAKEMLTNVGITQ